MLQETIFSLHFGKKRLPDSFKDHVTFTSHLPTMPDEHAYRFTLSVASGSEKLTWERVWYLADLTVEIESIDTAWNPMEVLELTKKHKLRRFKRDILHFLRRTHQCLIETENVLTMVPEGDQ